MDKTVGSRLLTFLVLFIIFDVALLGYVTYKHEKVHTKVAEYFGYDAYDIVLREGAISTATGVPASDLGTCKYWAYVAAQSSVDAAGYHVLMLVPAISAVLAGVGTWILRG